MSQIETSFAVNGKANGHPPLSSGAVNPSISMPIESDLARAGDAPLNSAAVSRMLLNLNREIRTPLASILGMTQMLLGTGLDQSQKEFVDAMDASAHSIASIVAALADSSKLLAASAMNHTLGADSENGWLPKAIATEAPSRTLDNHPPEHNDAESAVIEATAIEVGPPIDPVAIKNLREMDVDEEGFVDQLIDLFLTDMAARLLTMKAGVLAREPGPIRSTAHAVKGSCGHFGAARLASLCREIELIDPENLARDADGVFAQLMAEAELVRTALERERKAPSAATVTEGNV